MTASLASVWLLVLAAGAAIALVVALTSGGIAVVMRRTATSVGLPLSTDAVLLAVERRERRSIVATAVVVVALSLAGAIGVVVGGRSDAGSFLEVMAVVVAATTVTTSVVTARDQLFAPAPGAVRVASTAPRSVVAYLGRTRLVACPVLVGLGAALVALSALGGKAPAVALSIAAASVVGLALQPLLDRAVLRAPQPASGPDELAWDDAYRMRTLAGTRAALVWLAMLAATLAVTRDTGLRSLGLLVGYLVVSIAYSRIPLPPALRPVASHAAAAA